MGLNPIRKYLLQVHYLNEAHSSRVTSTGECHGPTGPLLLLHYAGHANYLELPPVSTLRIIDMPSGFTLHTPADKQTTYIIANGPAQRPLQDGRLLEMTAARWMQHINRLDLSEGSSCLGADGLLYPRYLAPRVNTINNSPEGLSIAHFHLTPAYAQRLLDDYNHLPPEDQAQTTMLEIPAAKV